jgi:type VI secretion system protein ImpH
LTPFEKFGATPRDYHIFLALRVIEAEFAKAPPIGTSRRPREDAVRLGQEAEMAFPPTTIRDFTPPQGAGPGRLTNRFFGFFGPHGPLPSHLTEYARDRQRQHGDPTLIAFADMLTHRMMSLLYRAWTTGQAAPSFDRGAGGAMEDKVAALAGQLGTHLKNRDAMPDLAKRHFAGHLARGPRNADGLIAILTSFFVAPVALQQFVGSWLELEKADCWQLGAPGGLGRTTSIGSMVWSRSAKFRLRIGPMSLADYRRLLPGGESLDRLKAIVHNYIGLGLDWDVNLILKASEVPPAVLGRDTQLGQTSWIGAHAQRSDAGDLYLIP